MASDNLTFEQQVFELTNQERIEKGLQPLKANAELNYVADKYAEDMSNGKFFSHIEPDGSTPRDRLEEVGYEAQRIGENIAKGQRTPQQVVQAWMKSSGHRANILNRNFTEIGTGFFNNHWVQNFGSGDLNPDTVLASPTSSEAGSNSISGSDVSTTQSVMGYTLDESTSEPDQESNSDIDYEKYGLINDGLYNLPSEGDAKLNDFIISQGENTDLSEQFVLDNRQILGSDTPFETPSRFASSNLFVENQNTGNLVTQIDQLPSYMGVDCRTTKL
ncbi:CAP domain-containing protein [Scytonema sp. NUACC26]|uniref:CAP domain-containing protein n=1 Tax=Scytonema sp. NUACC26 TaxID=3140176 RepID=UPI0034DB8BDC